MDVEFSAPLYGQLMQNRLLIFKPAIANRTSSVYLTASERKHPVVFDSNSFAEKAIFILPQGFVIDEMPEPVTIDSPFGKYTTTITEKEGKLEFTRELVLNRSYVPAAKYPDVRSFFVKMLEAEQSPVVLIRK